MLETKFVKHLQSRPKHVRVGIFMFVMATASLVLLSFLTASFNGKFLAETNPKSKIEQVVIASNNTQQKEIRPSLWSNMKANIGELADVATGVFVGSKNETQGRLNKESIRKIKPVKLPTNE